MKKAIIVVFCLSVALFAITAVVSAAETKEEYYNEINELLMKIRAALASGDMDEARRLLGLLREKVYECGTYLVLHNEYDPQLLDIINKINEAIESKNYEALIESADELAAEILLDKDAPPVPEVPQHS